MEVIEKSALTKRFPVFHTKRVGVFKVPLLPLNKIDIHDNIRFSLDFTYGAWMPYYDDYTNNTIVKIKDDKISFYFVSTEDIGQYDVTRWNDEYIYCKLNNARPFIFLEQIFIDIDRGRGSFIQDDKLYIYQTSKLMVFDISSDRIRKLGHFEQLSHRFRIESVSVLDNGDILMSAEKTIRWRKKLKMEDKRHPYNYKTTNLIYLLENPQ